MDPSALKLLKEIEELQTIIYMYRSLLGVMISGKNLDVLPEFMTRSEIERIESNLNVLLRELDLEETKEDKV